MFLSQKDIYKTKHPAIQQLVRRTLVAAANSGAPKVDKRYNARIFKYVNSYLPVLESEHNPKYLTGSMSPQKTQQGWSLPLLDPAPVRAPALHHLVGRKGKG